MDTKLVEGNLISGYSVRSLFGRPCYRVTLFRALLILEAGKPPQLMKYATKIRGVKNTQSRGEPQIRGRRPQNPNPL